MKKILFAVLCSISFVFAMQTAHAQKMGFGIKGGLNFSTLSGDFTPSTTTLNKESVTGYNIGAYGYLGFNPLLALEAEVNYTQLGVKYSGIVSQIGTSTTSITSNLTYNYIQIPILMRLQTGFSDFKVWGNVGPYVGLSLGGNNKSLETKVIGGIAGNITNLTPIDVPLKSGDDIQSVDFGVMAGAGIGYKVGPGYITFDARYVLGLNKSFNSLTLGTTANSLTVNYDDLKNRSIVLNLGYLFVF